MARVADRHCAGAESLIDVSSASFRRIASIPFARRMAKELA
jgi:hypothetical protein